MLSMINIIRPLDILIDSEGVKEGAFNKEKSLPSRHLSWILWNHIHHGIGIIID